MNYIELIKNYFPKNNQEKEDKKNILKILNSFDDVLTRTNTIVHLTASTFVVNKNKTKTLMLHHNIFDSWSFPGGHVDGDPNPLNVAIKELKEETGIINYKILDKNLISLDMLQVLGHIKNNNYVSPHLHISLTFLIEVDETEHIRIKKDENKAIAFIDINKIDGYTKKEPHMQMLFKKIISRLAAY